MGSGLSAPTNWQATRTTRNEPSVSTRQRSRASASTSSAPEWASGGSTIVRRLSDSHAIELLSGPATHPFQPLLDDEIASFALAVGRNDTDFEPVVSRPESGRPNAVPPRPRRDLRGRRRQSLHGGRANPAARGRSTADAWTIGDTDVVAFGRDLMSPTGCGRRERVTRVGPGTATSTPSNMTAASDLRVTSTRTPSESKAP